VGICNPRYGKQKCKRILLQILSSISLALSGDAYPDPPQIYSTTIGVDEPVKNIFKKLFTLGQTYSIPNIHV
jgi:hypothetical protein